MIDITRNSSVLKPVFGTLIIAIFTLQFSRFLFFTFNFTAFDGFSSLEILQAFIAGFKFDLVFVSYALFLYYFIKMSLFKSQILDIILKTYYVIILTVGFILNLIDTFYYSYSLKRSGIELASLIRDPANPIISYLKSFWFLIIFIFGIVYILWKVYPNFKQVKQPKITYRILGLFITTVLLFIGMRGGFGLKPIKSQDASKWVVMGLENLSLNTPFQIISSIDSDSEIFPFSHIPIENTISFYKEFSPVENKIKPNIVLVILESMGRDYVGFMNKEPLGLTPFIDSLAEHCAVFVNCYANSTRSAEAIPALYAGIPHILNKTFQYSIFQGNTIRGSHYYLNQIGYQNSFYHGAANGTMGFESFLKKTGPIKYHGLNQYPYKKEHHDGKWGIFDHHYLSYFAKELSKKEEPFFAGVFTLSSHHPFKVPDEYKQILPEGHMPIHKSVAYTDLSLRQFFSEVAKSKSHQNTIYIIIGDHTSQSHREYYATSKGRLELLCMVYDARNLIEKGVYFNTVQQIDLLPSILNIAGYTQKFLSLGNSFFDSSNSNIGAITLMDGNFQYIKNEHVLKLSPDKKVEFKYMPKDNFPDKFQTYYKKENEKVMKSELLQTLNFFWDRMEKNKFY